MWVIRILCDKRNTQCIVIHTTATLSWVYHCHLLLCWTLLLWRILISFWAITCGSMLGFSNPLHICHLHLHVCLYSITSFLLTGFIKIYSLFTYAYVIYVCFSTYYFLSQMMVSTDNTPRSSEKRSRIAIKAFIFFRDVLHWAAKSWSSPRLWNVQFRHTTALKTFDSVSCSGFVVLIFTNFCRSLRHWQLPIGKWTQLRCPAFIRN